MNDSRLFSFFIMTFKHFDGVIETIESVFKQDYPNIELVLSDDGSDNYAKEIKSIKQYIDSNKPDNVVRVVYSRLKQNQGIVKNINNAIRMSKGDYIKGLGGGDVLACPDALSRYASFLEQNQVNIVFAKLIGVTPDNRVVKHLAACEDDYDLLRSMSSAQLCDRLFSRNCLPAPAWCAKKELFEKNGLFHEDTRLIEDYSYWITLCMNEEKIGFMDDVMVRYKLDGVSSAGSYSVQFMEDMFTIYNHYVFPNDRRMGAFQPLYNTLKRLGLKTYMAKAKWAGYSTGEKLKTRIKYGPFFVYIWLGNKLMSMKNGK